MFYYYPGEPPSKPPGELTSCPIYPAGPDCELMVQDNNLTMCTVPEEQKIKKQTKQMPLSGAELAAMMKIGTRVMRGVDWKWGDQVMSSHVLSYYLLSDVVGLFDAPV